MALNQYKEYKDSGVEWIGEIPIEWNVLKLNYIADLIKSGGTPSTSNSEYWDGDINWITPEDFRNKDGKYLFDSNKKITNLGFKNCSSPLFKKGSIILSKRAPIGKVAIIKEMSAINQGNYGITINPNYSQEFYYYCLSILEKLLNSLGKGTTFLELGLNDLKNIKFPLPAPSIQERIAEFLDVQCHQIDKIIELKEQQIDILNKYRQSLITETITRGLNPKSKMKKSNLHWIGEIPDDFEVIKLKYLVKTKITDGPHETPIIHDEGVPFISAEAIKDGKVNFDYKRGYISKEDHSKFTKKCHPQFGDIFMVKSGATTGKIGIVETHDEFSIWSPLALIRANEKLILNKFLYYYMHSDIFQKQVQLGWNYGTQQNIGMGVIENLFVICPPIEVQNVLLKHFENESQSIADILTLLNNQIQKLKDFRQSLIYEAVTGKIDVRKYSELELEVRL